MRAKSRAVQTTPCDYAPHLPPSSIGKATKTIPVAERANMLRIRLSETLKIIGIQNRAPPLESESWPGDEANRIWAPPPNHKSPARPQEQGKHRQIPDFYRIYGDQPDGKLG